ncbi:type II toxin-antitoxin system prevent-host-death family antitoxin [Candidatus Daviesbacteria bacterium]|nr:type II toxin-antitoxin system prevent-host-death family antitoxin [Candidatus Daviesbacteria bacterium]
MINTISATELKNKLSAVLNSVYYNETVTIIEKHGKPIAEIVPVKKPKTGKMDIKKALDATFGILPDFPDVTKFRHSRRRKIPPLL